MVIRGKHGPARKPGAMGICILAILGGFVMLSFVFAHNSFSRHRHRHSAVHLELGSSNCGDAEPGKRSFEAGDPTLGGLLRPAEEYGPPGQCASRSEEVLIRKPSPYTPSSYLIAKLRKYEDRHRKCAPMAANLSQEGSNSEEDLGDCQFVVWIANSGLGNRMITILSAFVYALLTDRVLLLDHSRTDINGLFCEPFPGTSWLLPENYDYNWMNTLIWKNNHRLGHLLVANGFRNVTLPTAVPNNYVFMNLMHDYDDHDKRFFCSRVQQQLKEVPLLYWRSNNYVVPGLHFHPSFHDELDRMFPERHTVFHHMTRYLFRPSNLMWGLILRFRQPYLAAAQRQVGLQLRILESNVTASVVADQLLACLLEKELLPQQTSIAEDKFQSSKGHSTAVLVASLDSIYYEKLRNYYLDLPTGGREYIGVYSPSKEEFQQYGFSHDKKAWADMYLLSLSNALVTSPWSTFGYVAQALAGITPWILTRAPSLEAAKETFQAHGHCNRGVSLEPCFHAPPELDCEVRSRGLDSSTILPFIKPCEDVLGGVKIMPSEANDGIEEEKPSVQPAITT